MFKKRIEKKKTYISGFTLHTNCKDPAGFITENNSTFWELFVYLCQFLKRNLWEMIVNISDKDFDQLIMTFPENGWHFRGCLTDILYSISELVYTCSLIQLFLFTDSLIQFTVPPLLRVFPSGRWRLAATGLAPKIGTFFYSTSRPTHFSSISVESRTACAPPPASASRCSYAASRCCRSRWCAQARNGIPRVWR